MKELRCQKCPNGGLRIVHYPYAECVWGWTLDRQGCGALYRLDDDADGLTGVEAPLAPVPHPPLTTTYTDSNPGWFGRLVMGPMETAVDLGPTTTPMDASAWQKRKARQAEAQLSEIRSNLLRPALNFPEWGETA